MFMLPKILDLSKIRFLIHTLEKYNLETRIVSFPDHENLLKKAVVWLVRFTGQKKNIWKISKN